MGEVMDGGLGLVGEGGEEGEVWVGGWEGFWEGSEFEDRGRGGGLGRGGRERGWGGDRGSLGSFSFPFPGLKNNFAWVGVEIWSSEFESFSGEEGGVEGGVLNTKNWH